MKKVTYLFALIITAVAFTACSGTKAVSTSPGAIQGDWELTSMNNNDMSGESNYTLSFNTDGTVAGKANCNYFAGEYDAQQEGMVSFSGLSSTKATCQSGPDASEYISALKNTESFEVREGNRLILNTANGQLIFNKSMMENES